MDSSGAKKRRSRETPTSVRLLGSADGRLLWIPLLTVFVAIIALVGLPMLGERYVRPLHEDLRTVAEPGRSNVTAIHVSLAVEGAAVRDFIATRDSAVLLRYAAAAASEQEAYTQLRALVPRLGPSVARNFEEVDRLQRDWHATVDRTIRESAAGGATHRMSDQLFDDLLLGAARLDESIGEASSAKRAAIVAAESAQRMGALILGILAFMAALMVTWLGVQLRRFALEADRRRVELQRASDARERLFRGLSHDLKDPLNAIDGYVQMLQGGYAGPVTQKQGETLQRIHGSVQSLMALIRDLMELSRAEAGRLRVTPVPTSLHVVVADAVEDYRAAASSSGQKLEVSDTATVPQITTDATRVRQIVGNLLSNAVKYTPAGGRIVVRVCERVRSDSGNGSRADWMAVDVIDSGPGVPAHMASRIFEEFTRLEEHQDRPGAGLGLAVARRLARLLGGDVTVDQSELGGAMFTLWLPRDHRIT